MTVPTPGPVTKLLDAANSHQTEDFLASFAHDGVVDDWGRGYIGREAIKEWSDREFIRRESVAWHGFGAPAARRQPHSEAPVLLAARSALASGWSTCCLSWWRDFTPSLRNALRR